MDLVEIYRVQYDVYHALPKMRPRKVGRENEGRGAGVGWGGVVELHPSEKGGKPPRKHQDLKGGESDKNTSRTFTAWATTSAIVSVAGLVRWSASGKHSAFLVNEK